MCTTIPHWCAPFAPGDPTVPICTLHLQTISCVDLRGMRRGQHEGVIPDFRAPDGIRLGLSPLSTTFVELTRGLAAIEATAARR